MPSPGHLPLTVNEGKYKDHGDWVTVRTFHINFMTVVLILLHTYHSDVMILRVKDKTWNESMRSTYFDQQLTNDARRIIMKGHLVVWEKQVRHLCGIGMNMTVTACNTMLFVNWTIVRIQMARENTSQANHNHVCWWVHFWAIW